MLSDDQWRNEENLSIVKCIQTNRNVKTFADIYAFEIWSLSFNIQNLPYIPNERIHGLLSKPWLIGIERDNVL